MFIAEMEVTIGPGAMVATALVILAVVLLGIWLVVKNTKR
jgi:hypothetical protein